MLPTDQEIKALHYKYAKTDNDFDLVYKHCQIVETIAMQLFDAKPVAGVNRQLLHVGCLLHDIGTYDVLENGFFVSGIKHGVIGEKILKFENFPETIWRFASHHTGVGLTKQDVINQGLPIPVADYMAITNEEQLIMYADKFHSKSKPPIERPYFCTFEWIRNSIQKFGADKATKLDHLALLYGKPNLKPLSKQYGHIVKSI